MPKILANVYLSRLAPRSTMVLFQCNDVGGRDSSGGVPPNRVMAARPPSSDDMQDELAPADEYVSIVHRHVKMAPSCDDMPKRAHRIMISSSAGRRRFFLRLCRTVTTISLTRLLLFGVVIYRNRLLTFAGDCSISDYHHVL